jgi:hypothetical protein
VAVSFYERHPDSPFFVFCILRRSQGWSVVGITGLPSFSGVLVSASLLCRGIHIKSLMIMETRRGAGLHDRHLMSARCRLFSLLVSVFMSSP